MGLKVKIVYLIYFNVFVKLFRKDNFFFRNFFCIFFIKKMFYIWYKEMINIFFLKYSYGNI